MSRADAGWQQGGSPIEQTLCVNGRVLRASARGRGSPLLMLNGLGARIGLFDSVRSELSDFRTIAFDPPGIGGSPLGARPLGFPARLRHYAALAKGLLHSVGVDGPVDVLGVSLGGAIAQELAFRHPRFVRRLVLASTTALPFVVTDPKAYIAFFNPFRSNSEARFVRASRVLYGGRMRTEPALAQALRPHFESVLAPGRLQQQLAAFWWSSLPYIRSIRQPTLLVTGDDDPIMPAYNTRLLKRLLLRAQTHVISGEGHLLVATSPRETAKVVREFLLQPDGGGRA